MTKPDEIDFIVQLILDNRVLNTLEGLERFQKKGKSSEFNQKNYGVLHGTPKNFPGLGHGISRVKKTQVARIN